MNESSQDNSSRQIIEKIKSGQVKVRPRALFVFKDIILAVAAVLCFLAVVFLASFTLFVVRSNGAWLLTSFGWPGVRIFLISLPWVLFLVAAFFIFLLEYLLKRSGFVWRRPLIYSLAVILAVVTAGSFLAAATPLHLRAYQSAVQRRLPLAGPLYLSYGFSPPPRVWSGTITNLKEMPEPDEFQIEMPGGQRLKVELATSTGCKVIKKDRIGKEDLIMVVGEQEGEKIRAWGIRQIQDDQDSFLRDHKEIIRMLKKSKEFKGE